MELSTEQENTNPFEGAFRNVTKDVSLSLRSAVHIYGAELSVTAQPSNDTFSGCCHQDFPFCL